MSNGFNLAVTILAVDRFSQTFGKINQFTSKADSYFNKLNGSMMNMVNPMNLMGAGLGMKLLSDLQENDTAVIQLQNSMMKAGGIISPLFGEISKKVEQLGVALPGASKDFYSMASTLKNLGLADKSIVNSLDATARLAVILKPMGESYESVATGMGKFKNALGIADEDMGKFADTIQRTAHLKVGITEMQYAFAKFGIGASTMGWKGIEHADKLAAMSGMLISLGKTGEEVCTTLEKMFMTGHTQKLFNTEEGMFKWLEKSSEADLMKVFGKGGQDLDVAIKFKSEGLKGFEDFQKRMKEQASIEERSKNSLSSISNIIEAMSGTITKVSVSLGKLFGDDIKNFANSVNNFADGLSTWIDKNQGLAKGISHVAMGVVGLQFALGALSFGKNLVSPLIEGTRVAYNFYRVSKLLATAEAAGNMSRYYSTLAQTGTMGRLASGSLGSLASGINLLNPYVLAGAAAVGAMGLAYYAWNDYSMRHIDIAKLSKDVDSEVLEGTVEQRAKLKDLFQQIIHTNAGSKERLELSKQIKNLSPDVAKGLDLENASVQKLKDSYAQLVAQILTKNREENLKGKIQAQMKEVVETEDKMTTPMSMMDHFAYSDVNQRNRVLSQKRDDLMKGAEEIRKAEAKKSIIINNYTVLDGKVIAKEVKEVNRVEERATFMSNKM